MSLKVRYEDRRTPRMTLAEFGEQWHLTLVITRQHQTRWTVNFDNAEVKEGRGGGILGSAYGDGITPAAAAKNYAEQITGQTLVIDAMQPERREISVPVLTDIGDIEGVV